MKDKRVEVVSALVRLEMKVADNPVKRYKLMDAFLKLLDKKKYCKGSDDDKTSQVNDKLRDNLPE